MKSIFCFLLAALLSASVNAATSYPVLQCVNEGADKNECARESQEAMSHIQSWFDPYMNSSRRHLLDCERFCDHSIKYFTFQLPCSCQNRRVLTEEVDTASGRELNLEYLDGPIQLFEAYATGMPLGRCKEVFSRSICIVSFVTAYDFTKADMEANNAAQQQNDVTYDQQNGLNISALHPIDSQVYDPVTGETHRFDPTTGKIIP